MSSFRRVFAAGAAGLLLFGGCSREASVQRHQDRAAEYYAEGKFAEAELELLNVLRRDQNHGGATRLMGLVAFEQGNIGLAHAFLSRARQADGSDSEVRLKLAQCVLAAGGMQGANEAREEAIALLAKDPANGAAMTLLVESSVSPTQLNDAAARLDKLKAAGKPEFQLAWGLIQLRARDFAAAEDSLKKATQLDPKLGLAYVALGNLYTSQKRSAEAERAYRTAADVSPVRSPHRLHYIDLKVATGQLAEAKTRLDEITKQAADYSPALARVARIAMAEKRYEDAEKSLYTILGKDALNFEAGLLLGRLRIAQDKLPTAIQIFEGLTKNYPKAAQGHYELAVARLRHSGAAPEVFAGLNQALALQPDFSDAVLLLADLNIGRGDHGAAVAGLTRLVAQNRGFPRSHLLLAIALQAQGRTDSALTFYQRVRETWPDNPEIPWRMATLQRQTGKMEEARKNCEAALAIDPSFITALEELVQLEIDAKRFSAARERVQKQITAGSNEALLQILLGRIHNAEGSNAAAESAFLKSIALAPETTQAHTYLARLYVASNRHREALERLNEVVRKNGRDIGAWLQLASLHSELNNGVEARSGYERALEISPQLVPALNNLAWLLAKNRADLDRAFELASLARRLQPHDPVVADTLGWIHYQKGEYPRAAVLLREAMERLPGDPQVMTHFGLAHYVMGEPELAKKTFQAVLSKDPEGEWGKEAKQRIRVLEIDPKEASPQDVAFLEDAAAKLANDPVIVARLGAIAERDRKWDRAVAAYEKALGINPHFIPAMSRLAQLHSTEGGSSERALHYARLVRKADAEDANAAYILGKHTLAAATTPADFQRALTLLQEATRKRPLDPNIALDYAIASYANGQVAEAKTAVGRAVESQSEPERRTEAREFLELVQLGEDGVKAAAHTAKLEAALAKDGDSVPALMGLGMAREQAHDFRAAVGLYEKALGRYPLFAPAMVALSRIYLGPIRDTAKAFDHANRARELLPKEPEVARILGLLEYDREKYARAAQLLAEASEHYPTDAEVYFRLGIARHRLRQMTESKAALTKALELSPRSQLATHARLILAEIK